MFSYLCSLVQKSFYRKRRSLVDACNSIYDIPTYASSVTGGARQHLLANAFVLLLGRDIPFALLAPLLSCCGSLCLSQQKYCLRQRIFILLVNLRFIILTRYSVVKNFLIFYTNKRICMQKMGLNPVPDIIYFF